MRGALGMTGRERLEEFLREHGISYRVEGHPLAFTAARTAEVEHIPGRKMMKVVIVEAEGRPVMLVIPANDRVDVAKAAAILGVRYARLAHEDEFLALFPDCEAGAMPPFGNLYGLPVYVDARFVEVDEVAFPACSHTESIIMGWHDYQRLARPVVTDLIEVGHAA